MARFSHDFLGLETAAKSVEQQTLQLAPRLRPSRAGFTFEGRVGFAMEEIWKPIAGYEGLYEVSNLGRVRALFYGNHGQYKPGRVLKFQVSNNGYRRVEFNAPGKRPVKRTLHTLVLEAFKGPRPVGNVARHLDGVKINNVPENLEWGTRSENESDAKRHGTRIMGETHPMAKLTPEDVLEIRAMRSQGMTYPRIAAKFGIDQSNVYCIVKGKTWTQV